MLSAFQTYPFEKLSQLLADLSPKDIPIDLTIGEPQFPTPQAIQDALCQASPLLNKYPKSKGEESLKLAQLRFLSNRFGIQLSLDQIIPTLGTREVLFNFPHFYLSGIQDPHIAYPNPFYQVYEGGAIASGAKSIYIDLHPPHKPRESELSKIHLLILNSPNNPTGETLSLEELEEWVRLSKHYGFVILSDECYSEIYQDTPPHSILEACITSGNKDFTNILALNSISKRSSAPSLRSGLIAGDAKILKAYGLYRSYLGCAIPLPLQKASEVAWGLSSQSTRLIYAQNLKIAQEIFAHTPISPYSFYLWLEVGDDLAFTRHLYQDYSIKVLPGRFLGREGAGEGFVRLALIYEPSIIAKALTKVRHALKYFTKENK